MKLNQFLKFEPILKEKIWGGKKLSQLLNKSTFKTNIGESWEISGIENDTSLVSNGVLKGKSLKEVISIFKGDLVGDKIFKEFGEKFPLLIKYIDAREALSIQLHPNDTLAKERHNSFGKTEMWYVMQADEKANIIVGFEKEVTSKDYVKNLESKTLLDILNVDEVSSGDVYFIPAGRVHAIGAGVLLAEIQQTSDITYRIYDWDRPNPDGTYRDLHTEEAINVIDYKVQDSYKTAYSRAANKSSEVVTCPYFTTNILSISKSINVNHSDKDSFVIYMCVKGDVEFTYQNEKEKLSYGQTILVPACINRFEISSTKDSELLEVFIK